MNIVIIDVLYDDENPASYKGIELRPRWLCSVINVSGGTAADDYALASKIAHSLCDTVMSSSSVDHFVMDGGDLGE